MDRIHRRCVAVDAFYRRGSGDTFEATDATTSPWDVRFQHAGPPLALIARIVDERLPSELRIGRITLDISGPIPKTDLTLEVALERPGRRVEYIRARLYSGGREALAASVWRFAALAETPPLLDASLRRVELAPPPGPEARLDLGGRRGGYFAAFEWRGVYGSSDALGPAAVWCSTALPLIAGEPPAARDQLLALSDSANGISLELPLETWLSIPTSVTVSLARDPIAGWSYLAATTQIGPDGRGVTTGILGDEHGVTGNIVQALLVSRRAPSP